MSAQLALDFSEPSARDRGLYRWTDRQGREVLGVMAAYDIDRSPTERAWLVVRIEAVDGRPVLPYEERYGKEPWPSFAAHGWESENRIRLGLATDDAEVS